jgi:hypothetical protein
MMAAQGFVIGLLAATIVCSGGPTRGADRTARRRL